jgi:Fe-S cluster assembly protein SufD
MMTSAFAAWQPAADEPGFLKTVRQKALDGFGRDGWPTKRHESWRFTDLKPIVEGSFVPAPVLASVPEIAPDLEGLCDRLVVVNGRLVEARSEIGSLPAGVFLGSFAAWAKAHPEEAEALLAVPGGADHAFEALSAGLFADGFALVVPDGVTLERPVRIIHQGVAETAAASHIRSVIRIGAGASAQVVESWDSTGPHWHNVALSVSLGAKARLGHYKLQREGEAAYHTASLTLDLAESTQYDGFALVLGAARARQDVTARLGGRHIHCAMNGAYLLGARQEATTVTMMDHAAPDCISTQTIKGCLADRAHGVFQGRILVREDAQKTDARMLNKTVLLSDRAVMDTKPELEIFADDVKCAHGASIGDLDETALFYLRSRGIEPDAARTMLIEAFVVDAVDQVDWAPARALLGRAIAQWLAAHRQ